MHPLLEVKHLEVTFHTRYGMIPAVRDVSFLLEKGKTLGIVGESGSGKSVSMLSLMGLIPKSSFSMNAKKAHFYFQDRLIDLTSCPTKDLQYLRGCGISMIFQDPMTALNPYLTIETQLTEGLIIKKLSTRTQAKVRALEMLDRVGIPDPKKRIKDYPHQFSGGMRQRVMIAMALMANPSLLIADEPTTALDVTIQAQILALLQELQKETGMAMILISHDLGVMAEHTDQIVVMYAGKLMEQQPTANLFKNPLHPYTQGLLGALPALQLNHDAPLKAIPGLPPDPTKLPKGCPFSPRCEKKTHHCSEHIPAWQSTSLGLGVSCFEVNI